VNNCLALIVSSGQQLASSFMATLVVMWELTLATHNITDATLMSLRAGLWLGREYRLLLFSEGERCCRLQCDMLYTNFSLHHYSVSCTLHNSNTDTAYVCVCLYVEGPSVCHQHIPAADVAGRRHRHKVTARQADCWAYRATDKAAFSGIYMQWRQSRWDPGVRTPPTFSPARVRILVDPGSIFTKY